MVANRPLCTYYPVSDSHSGTQLSGSLISRTAQRKFAMRRPMLYSWRSRLRRFMRRRFNFYQFLVLAGLLFFFLSEVPGRVSSPSLIRQMFVDPHDVRPGVSVVAVCMNRHNTLRTVLDKWRNVVGVDEIVIVDWSSEPPLQPIVQANPDPRIKLIRVDGESEWVLSRAYNLAISASSHERIIRTDCDYALGRYFVDAHPLRNSGAPKFYAGNYRLARNPNEVHLNGAVVIRRADFFKVGGYDERIQTYGWDDEDLYTRLDKAGISKSDVNYAHLYHVPHGDDARAQHDVRFVQVEIDLNRILLEKLNDSWTGKHMAGSRWSIDPKSSSKYFRLKSLSAPRSLKQLSSSESYDEAWKLALEQRLANDYHVPWDILVYLDTASKRKLLNRMNKKAAARAENKEQNKPVRILFAHCMHGLGNRLRALGSAMSYAHATDRELVVIWETDAHISAKFTDLFSSDLVVLPKMKVQWPFQGVEKWDASWNSFKFINYMEMEGHGAKKGAWIVDEPSKHMYFKSAYIMEADAKLTSWDMDNRNLRSLLPVASVADRIVELEKMGLSKMVGVHIRDRTLNRDIKNVNFKSEYGDEASNTMEYWRRKSSHLNFIKEMHRLLKEDPTLKFYVATDTVNVVRRLRDEFGNRVTVTERDCDSRDGFCIRYALIDILALGKTNKLLGSNWSSFTEAAERIGGKKALLAGKDFAVDNVMRTAS